MAASILFISISRNVNYDIMVGFPKSGHIYVSVCIKCMYIHVSCILDSTKSAGAIDICCV